MHRMWANVVSRNGMFSNESSLLSSTFQWRKKTDLQFCVSPLFASRYWIQIACTYQNKQLTHNCELVLTVHLKKLFKRLDSFVISHPPWKPQGLQVVFSSNYLGGLQPLKLDLMTPLQINLFFPWIYLYLIYGISDIVNSHRTKNTNVFCIKQSKVHRYCYLTVPVELLLTLERSCCMHLLGLVLVHVQACCARVHLHQVCRGQKVKYT